MSEEGTNMPSRCETCREPALLLWLAAGALEENERARIENSARKCPACSSRLAEGDALARAVRSSGPSPAPLSPEALVRISQGPRDESVLRSLSPDDRAILDVLRGVDSDLEARERRAKWREWLSGIFAAIAPAPGAGLAAWLRSPAVAYLALLALVYPAYRGVVAGPSAGEPAPLVLSSPLGIDDANRGEPTPGVFIEEGTGPSVVTVFVPVDERYRYRLEILDSAGGSRFRKDDARSFDAYGTFAVLLPEGVLSAGEYELRVEELDEDGRAIEVFRFPFRVER